MKIFLTGGTGFIGQSLTKALLARGWMVIALVRNAGSSQARALTTMGAQCIVGDITTRESLRAGMIGADVVIHTAGLFKLGISKNARKLMHTINVTGTENVLSLALELGIPRTLHISTYTYFGDTINEIRDETYHQQTSFTNYYEQTKAEAHQVALQYHARGLPLVIVCPAHVVGPNDHSPYGYFQRMYVNKFMPPFAWGRDTFHSPVHVTDLAEGIALATEKGKLGETYLLTGESTRLHRIFEIWQTQPGGFRVRFYMPFWLMALMFAPMEPIQRWLGMPAIMSREMIWSTTISRRFSSAKAQRELGWAHRSAEELWVSVLDEEHKLIPARRKRNLLSRLKPLEADE
jgi:nucleoside-diphosphate-sugar epimerase